MEADQNGTRHDPPSGTLHDAGAFIAEVPLFAELGVQLRQELAESSRWVHLPAGEYLFHQGDATDTLALVWSGRLEVIDELNIPSEGLRGPPVDPIIGVLGRGGFVGELSLITGSPRSAGVRALRDSELLLVSRTSFTNALEREPHLGLKLAKVLAQRLQNFPSAELAPIDPDTIFVLPLDNVSVVDPFVWRISHNLASFGPVAVMGDGGAVLQSDGPNAGPVDHYGVWAKRLDDLESQHAWVILVSSNPAAENEWATFCKHSSDRILAIGHGGAPDSWAVDLVQGVRTDLVFVGSSLNGARMQPALDALHPRTHHHLSEGADFNLLADRVARRASGHALGIVFSGGGARGLAHLGVIERLIEDDVLLDRVGGCSAGAFAAGLFAMGRTPTEMIEICREEFADHHPFTDFTVPREALIKGRRVMSMLTRVFGDTRIEELSIPMFAVSADLGTGELVVHRSGLLRDALAASMSIPGFTPPISIGGHLLVDGGLLDNLPVDVMCDMDEGPVIGVDVMRRFPLPEHGGTNSPSVSQERGKAKNLGGPGIVSTIARSMVLGGRHRVEQNRNRAALLISPAVDNIGLFEFDRIDDAIRAGRLAAESALSQGLLRPDR